MTAVISAVTTSGAAEPGVGQAGVVGQRRRARQRQRRPGVELLRRGERRQQAKRERRQGDHRAEQPARRRSTRWRRQSVTG